jgi:hypothetical protein
MRTPRCRNVSKSYCAIRDLLFPRITAIEYSPRKNKASPTVDHTIIPLYYPISVPLTSSNLPKPFFEMSEAETKLVLPTTITGGCLCGSIRYNITFPKDAEWPPSSVSVLARMDILWRLTPLSNTTCQCTQCRKFTGCLIPQNVTIPTSYITPSLSSYETYKSFESSPSAYRSFCSVCGSSLAFNEHATPHNTEIFLGSLDEDILCGEIIAGQNPPHEARNSGDEHEIQRGNAEAGEVLAKAKNHIWLDNAVRGVTDQNLHGGLYRKDREEKWRIVK